MELSYYDFLLKSCKKEEDFLPMRNAMESFIKQIHEYDQRNRKDGIAGFIDEISLNDEREDKDDITDKKGVCLITMHASKGLEFPVVYIPGCEQGLIPHKRSWDEGRVDEERRLFYVGITRAREKLTLSYVRWRMKYGERIAQLPSPFLKELDRKHIKEHDYAQHMQTQATVAENSSFLLGLKSMIQKD